MSAESSNAMLPPVEPGTLFADKYLIEKHVASGGMGAILLAVHTHLEQRVAIKLLTGSAALDKERVGRFYREAKGAARIQSEHVVRILDFGIHAETEAPYLVMEYLEGTDLAKMLRDRGPQSIETTIHYFLQACSGVAKAHFAGIIHRDLKPSNLFLAKQRDGTTVVKVLDFGASKLTAECSLSTGDVAATLATSLIGSPRYMAPEQLTAAHEVDARADVYSLGATLYELLCGEPVVSGETIASIFTKILWDTPKSPSAIRPGIPPGLEGVVMKALKRAPEERFSSVKELVEALAEFAPTRSLPLVDQVARIGKAADSVAPPVRRSLVPPPPVPQAPRIPSELAAQSAAASASGLSGAPAVGGPPAVNGAAASGPARPSRSSEHSISRTTVPSLSRSSATALPPTLPPVPWRHYAAVGVGIVLAGVLVGALLFFTLMHPRRAGNTAGLEDRSLPIASRPG